MQAYSQPITPPPTTTKDGVRVVDTRIGEVEARRPVGRGAGGDQEELAGKPHGGAIRAAHRDGVRIHKRGRALIQGDAVPVEILTNPLPLAFDDKLFTAHEIADSDFLLEAAEIEAVELAVAKAGQEQGRLAQGLGGQRAGIGRRPAQDRLPLDEGDPLAEVSGRRRPLLAGRARADDDEIVGVDGHGQMRCLAPASFAHPSCCRLPPSALANSVKALADHSNDL